MIVTSFGLGIAVGFLFFELTGLTAGGIIVPGYFALYIEEPGMIFLTLVTSLAAYVLVLLIGNFAILYGRRRFLVFIILGFLLKFAVENLSVSFVDFMPELQVIGYLIPGIIANEFARQGIIKTILALGIVSLIVYIMMKILFVEF